MNIRQKIYLAAGCAAFIAAAFAWSSIGSYIAIERREKAVRNAAARADALAREAEEKEKQANEYKEKTEYLDRRIAELRAIAAKQKAEGRLLEDELADARAGNKRAARVRAINTTAAELCGKLAELGHSCRE